MIIDCHMHLWETAAGADLVPRDYGRFASRDGTLHQMLPVSFVDSSSPAELALAHMDWLGIDRGVVVQEWMDGRQDAYLSGVARRYPDRFSLMGLLDLNDPENAPAYIEDIVRRLSLDGVKVIPGQNRDVRLDDARLRKVWRSCAALGVPAVMHLPPGEAALAEVETIVRDEPSFRLVVAHLGLPPADGWQRQVALGRLPNVFIDASGLTALFAHEGYPFPGAQKAIREALDIVGPGKIMWGSDYARCLVDVSYKEILDLFRKECPFLTAAERAGILGETAARVYRFGGTRSPLGTRRLLGNDGFD